MYVAARWVIHFQLPTTNVAREIGPRTSNTPNGELPTPNDPTSTFRTDVAPETSLRVQLEPGVVIELRNF